MSKLMWSSFSRMLAEDSHDHADHDSHDHDEHASSGTILLVQLLFMAVIIVLTILPACVSIKKLLSERSMSLLRVFSGGIFLAMGLFHLLVDAQVQLAKVLSLPLRWRNELGYILAIVGYLLVLTVDKVIFGGHSHGSPATFQTPVPMTGDEVAIESTHTKAGKSSTIYVLLLALSIHALFEGLAMGVQSEISGVVSLGVGILAHKWAESLSLSVSFKDTPENQIKRLIVLFTFITPLGMVIGILVNQLASPLLIGITLALSSGTFIYIACSERFTIEFDTPEHRVQKLLVVIAAVGMIIGLSHLHKH